MQGCAEWGVWGVRLSPPEVPAEPQGLLSTNPNTTPDYKAADEIIVLTWFKKKSPAWRMH